MAADQQPSNERITSNSVQSAQQLFIEHFPPYPEDLKKRFPSLQQHEDLLKLWVERTLFNIRGSL